MRPMLGVLLKVMAAVAILGWSAAGYADPSAAPPGECTIGFCGTPENNGGGCGCGCGCSILVDYTDIGVTYSSSDLDPDHDGVVTATVVNGVTTVKDNCAFLFNPDQLDADGDGIGDVCDNCPTVANPDQFSLGAHKDAQGFPIGYACDTDGDGDGILNAADNCPAVKNADQADFDHDGIGDLCDEDQDGDGVRNVVGVQPYDNCPRFPNANQALPTAAADLANCNIDTDKDSVLDAQDNCPGVPNPDQKKTVAAADYKGNQSFAFLGDACNPDIDGDTIQNHLDNCPLVANPDQADDDNNGVGNACQTTSFCMHPIQTDSTCLDPTGVFDVYAFPTATVNTGNKVYLNVFANRQNVGIRYTFQVEQKPDGSNVGVQNAQGAVATSEGYEYHYATENDRPIFVADKAGVYTIRLLADLVQPDPLFATALHSESVLTLTAQGADVPGAGGGGCSMTAASTHDNSGMWFGVALAALALLSVGFRSLRRRQNA